MRNRTHYFLIGSFVVLGTVLLVLAIIALGSGTFGRDALTVETYLQESVQGLENGAHVRFRGVRIGEVTEITLVTTLYETDLPYVAVRCSLRGLDPTSTPDHLRGVIEQRVAEGFRVRLASMGLTGALYLETDLVANADRVAPPLPLTWAPHYPYIPSAPSTITQLSNSIDDVLRMVKQTDLPGLVGEIKDAIANVSAAFAGLDLPDTKRRADAAIDGFGELVEQLRRDSRGLADRAGAFLAELQRSVDAAAVSELVSSLASAGKQLEPTLGSFRQTLAQAEVAIGELRGQVRGTGRELTHVLDNLRRASDHLATLSGTLERYPSLLLFGNPPQPRGQDR